MKNKKAQIFVIMAVLMIILAFLSFEIYSSVQKKNVVKTRVSTMDNFLFSLEKNLERQVYISGFRILFLAEDSMTSTGEFIDVDDFFNEAFFNGTVSGVSSDILIGATYYDILNSINDKANKLNVNVTLVNPVIEVGQDNPWSVKFSLVTNFSMIDNSNLARWDKQQIISVSIPVTEFEDPLYALNTYSRISRKISQTPYEGNYVIGSDVSNLLDHVNNNYYATNTDAPSFLGRLEGNLSSNENGIESFVNIPELIAQGVPPNTKTDIDYIYFSSSNPAYNHISGMPAWFRIDNQNNHYNKYGVSALLI